MRLELALWWLVLLTGPRSYPLLVHFIKKTSAVARPRHRDPIGDHSKQRQGLAAASPSQLADFVALSVG